MKNINWNVLWDILCEDISSKNLRGPEIVNWQKVCLFHASLQAIGVMFLFALGEASYIPVIAGLLFLLAGIAPTVLAFALDLSTVVSERVPSFLARAKMTIGQWRQQKRTAKHFETLGQRKISPYVSMEGSIDLTSMSQLLAICRSVVQQHFRSLTLEEQISLIEVSHKFKEGKKEVISVTVTFLYERSLKVRRDGVDRDVLVHSGHTIQLFPDGTRIVDIEHVLSQGTRMLSGLDDVRAHVLNVAHRLLDNDIDVGSAEKDASSVVMLASMPTGQSRKSSSSDSVLE